MKLKVQALSQRVARRRRRGLILDSCGALKRKNKKPLIPERNLERKSKEGKREGSDGNLEELAITEEKRAK